MFLLSFLEEQLGTINSWPTYVLKLLFTEELNTVGIASLAAFFFGNAIPLNAALAFCLCCNYDDPAIIQRMMTLCYEDWHTAPNSTWLVIYYNMKDKRQRFINGPVIRVRDELPMGFDDTRTPEVERKLQLARYCPYFPKSDILCVPADLPPH